MDTSEIYIKMCEKAEEIQTLNVAHPIYEHIYCVYGNVFYSKDLGYQDVSQKDCNTVTEFLVTWLPHQKQLQRMVKQEDEAWRTLLFRFSRFAMTPKFCDNSKIHFDYIWSPEMLWLAFVMKEKYNKNWNGEEWINPDKTQILS